MKKNPDYRNEDCLESQKKHRRLSQLKAERNHEMHRVSHKIVANKKTNPDFAEKLIKYKESNLLTALLRKAIIDAPDNPHEFAESLKKNQEI